MSARSAGRPRPVRAGAAVAFPFAAAVAVAAVLLAFAPARAAAQFGAVEALASRVSDLSFYYGRGEGGRGALDRAPFGLTSFGVELLFEVAEVPSPAAKRRLEETAAKERRVLEGVEVRREAGGGADTIYTYEVTHPSPSYSPDDIRWTLELGIGYGQVQGVELREPTLDLSTMIRTLPTVTLYITYEPIGTYIGLRTGFMRTDALQVLDGDRALLQGSAQAFLMGGVLGYALSVGPGYLFLEGGYTARSFPSVEWDAHGPLPDGVPLKLDVSGWGLAAGIQFPVK